MRAHRRIVTAAAAFAIAAAFPAIAQEIPPGTHVMLRMMNSITTRTAQVGDYVYLRTGSPIAQNGRIVAPVGSYIQGVVSHVKRAGRVSGRAELGIRLETLTFPGGRVVRIAPRLDSVDSQGTGQRVERRENTIEQGGEKGRDAGRVAIYAGSGAAIGGITDRGWKGAGIGAGIGGAVGLATVLLTRGRDVDLRQGASLDVVFDRPVTLQ